MGRRPSVLPAGMVCGAQRRDLLLRRQPPLRGDVRLSVHAANGYGGHGVHRGLPAAAARTDAGGDGLRDGGSLLEHHRAHGAAGGGTADISPQGVSQPAADGAVLHHPRLFRRADGTERPVEAAEHGGRRKG